MSFFPPTFFYSTHLKKKYLHRLIAEHFIPNTQNKKEVNHIDGNKINCAIENLEWATSSENLFN